MEQTYSRVKEPVAKSKAPALHSIAKLITIQRTFAKTHCTGTWTHQKDQEEQPTTRTRKSPGTRTYEKSKNSIETSVCDKKEEILQVESYSSWYSGGVNPFWYRSFLFFSFWSKLFFPRFLWNTSPPFFKLFLPIERFLYSEVFFPLQPFARSRQEESSFTIPVSLFPTFF